MPVGRLAPLKAEFEADPQGIADRFRFEQRFVTRRAPGGVLLATGLGGGLQVALHSALPAELRPHATDGTIEALHQTAVTSGMIYLILFGAECSKASSPAPACPPL